MWYFIFTIYWSQTDTQQVIVVSSNKTDAETKLRQKFPDAIDFGYNGKTQRNIVK